MCSRHRPNGKRKCVIDNSSLSASALDYYKNHGQGRDLEKFLRVKPCNTSKSSSDGSLKNVNADENCAQTSGRKLGKSLDELSARSKGASASKSKDNKKSASADEANEDKKNIRIKKSAVQKVERKTKTKSYSFNSESSVEIVFPAEFGVPSYHFGQASTSAPYQNQMFPASEQVKKMLSDSANQTERPIVEEPEEAVVATTSKEAIALPETPRNDAVTTPNPSNTDVSPTSSIASNKMGRLEWDSLADIGYKLVDMHSDSSLTSYEKSALMKFFTERGLTFDDKLVIFATPDKSKSTLQPIADADRKKQKQSMKEKWKKAAEQLPRVKDASPTTSKNLWEKALNKYKQRYGKAKSPPQSAEPSLQTLSMHQPQSQSTPISNVDEPKEMRDACHNTTFHENIRNASSQTSEIEVEAKGIQVQDDDRGKFLLYFPQKVQKSSSPFFLRYFPQIPSQRIWHIR